MKEVVCIQEDQYKKLKIGKIYPLLDSVTCVCGNVLVDVGVPLGRFIGFECQRCSAYYPKQCLYNASRFVPIESIKGENSEKTLKGKGNIKPGMRYENHCAYY